MQIWLIFRDSFYDNSALFGLAIKWPLTFEDDFEFVHLKIDFANSGWWSRLNSFRCWMVLSLFLPNNSMYFCRQMWFDESEVHIMTFLPRRTGSHHLDVYQLLQFCNFGTILILSILRFRCHFFFQTQIRVPWGFFSLSNQKNVQKYNIQPTRLRLFVIVFIG